MSARRRVQSRLRPPAMLWPYLGLACGLFLLYRMSQKALAQLWWLAPGAVLVYLMALTLTVAAMSSRRRRDAARERELTLLAERLRAATAAGAPALRQVLEHRMSRLDVVKQACADLTRSEVAAVRVALAELGAHDTLTRQLRRRYGKRRRVDALFVLGWIGDERSVPALAAALNGRDGDLAYVAGQALAEYDSAPAFQALVAVLRTGTLERPLVATLLESSLYAGGPALVAAEVGSPNAAVRSWVAFLLGRSADPRARGWLVPLASDADAEVRASAAHAYGSFPHPEILSRLLHDKDPRVRASAAKAVGHAQLAALVPSLTPLMSDRTWWVRQSAATALKELGQASVDQLRRLLTDDDRFVRNKAAEILIEVGFISEQIAALSGRPEQVAAARLVLVAVVQAEARSTLEGAIEAADPATRQQLIALLGDVDDATARVGLAA